MTAKYYITTTIPYVNASPHIGYAMELVEADCLTRFYRQRGRDVFLLTGSDENSLKNVLAAEKEGISTKELIDKYTKRFTDLTEALNISNDDFIRTTENRHFAGAQKLWSMCRPEDIYKKSYKGLYCVGCEQFYTTQELVDGNCPEHQRPPEVVEEENYFFKLSNYQKKLEDLIESDMMKIVPESRKNEVLSFVRSGLQDFSISRSIARARNWGVPVPNDENQVMYVWYDALSNYITALDYATDGEKFNRYWPADVHMLGKGVIRFHAVYWPAMLLSAQLPLPKELFVHGYINADGVKMSKSLGNVVDPFEEIKEFGVEAVRYYLLRYIHPTADSDYSRENFEMAYNADLANGLGNLVNRIAGLCEQNNISLPNQENLSFDDATFDKLMTEYKFDQALKHLWDLVSEVDGYITQTKPWEFAKKGEIEELKKVLHKAIYDILKIAYLLSPIMPKSAHHIQQLFTSDKIINKEALFPRRDLKQ
jgi:methionyl-tRNA synthetase